MFYNHRHRNLFSVPQTSLIAATVAIALGGLISSTPSVNAKIPANAIAQSTTDASSLIPSGKPKVGVGWQVTTNSGEAEIALARHLTRIGAKEYAAWWCPYCHIQKQLFGKQAYRLLTSIECDAQGTNAQPKLCQAAKIESLPTWQINGKLYPGLRSLNELARISGYKSATNFKNFPNAFP